LIATPKVLLALRIKPNWKPSAGRWPKPCKRLID
jgi:hypothetical protein